MTIRQKSILYYLIIGCVGFLLVIGCAEKTTEPKEEVENGSVQLTMSLAPAFDNGFEVDSVYAKISKGSTVKEMSLTINDTIASGTFKYLEPGVWTVEIEIYDDGTLIAQGSGEGEVIVGQTTTVYITIEFVVGNLEIIVDWVTDTLPNIEITEPEEGFVWDDTIEIKVNATDNDGIDRVVIFIDSIFVSEDYNEPYSYQWITTDYLYGKHYIEAKAYDNNGNTSNTGIFVTLSPCPVFEEDLQNFQGITETDSDGNLTGNIDPDDWHFEPDTLCLKINAKNDSLPVKLSSFTATAGNCIVILEWTTQSETDNQGFNVFRATTDNLNSAYKINLSIIPGHGTTTEPHYYTFEDDTVMNGVTYYYWLEQVDYSGASIFHGPVSATPHLPVPDSYSFGPAYPNPCESGCSIPFVLPESSEIIIIIIDEDGELIEILVKAYMSAGYHNIVWNTLENNKLYRCIFHQSDSNHWHGDILFE